MKCGWDKTQHLDTHSTTSTVAVGLYTIMYCGVGIGCTATCIIIPADKPVK